MHKTDFGSIFFFPIVTGIVSGVITSLVYNNYQRIQRLEKIASELNSFVGKYDVYHWRDLTKPDTCNYQIIIELDKKNASLAIHQIGMNDYDELVAQIKIEEQTFTYGEGNYIHPKKENTPTGRMKLFLIDKTTINVDKTYSYMKDESNFLPAWEKWQWRKRV